MNQRSLARVAAALLTLALMSITNAAAFENLRYEFTERGFSKEKRLVREYLDKLHVCGRAAATLKIKIGKTWTFDDDFIALVEGPCGLCNKLGCKMVFFQRGQSGRSRATLETFGLERVRLHQPENLLHRGLCVQTKLGAELFVKRANKYQLVTLVPDENC